jgi:predicted RNA methylase
MSDLNKRHRVRVAPLPDWLDAQRLLGDGDWEFEPDVVGAVAATAPLDHHAAADVAARLRGIGLGGAPVVVDVSPPLKRTHVRAARTEDARRRRDTTPAFLRPGTRLDDEGRFSLTPEPLAMALGERLSGRTVLDVTCGGGGDAIAFARCGCEVTAVERDAERLRLARHNARVYGVEENIAFVAGDAVREAAARSADVLYVDAPWGEDWDRTRTTLADLPLLAGVLKVAGFGDPASNEAAPARRYRTVVAKVPSSFDPSSVPGATPEAVFGIAPGDFRRVKYVLLWIGDAPTPARSATG